MLSLIKTMKPGVLLYCHFSKKEISYILIDWTVPKIFSQIVALLSTCHFFLILFIFRGEGKDKERERNINVWEKHPLIACSMPPTKAPGLLPRHGNWTGDLLVHRPALNPLSHTSQGKKLAFSESSPMSFFGVYFIYLFVCLFIYLFIFKDFIFYF